MSDSYLSLLHGALHQLLNLIEDLSSGEPDAADLSRTRERLAVATQLAKEVGSTYRMPLEAAERALWKALRSQTPKPYIDEGRAWITETLDEIHKDQPD